MPKGYQLLEEEIMGGRGRLWGWEHGHGGGCCDTVNEEMENGAKESRAVEGGLFSMAEKNGNGGKGQGK